MKFGTKKIALLGIASGLLLLSQGQFDLQAHETTHIHIAHASCGSCNHTSEPAPKGNIADDTLTSKLTERAKALYISLDDEGKKLAHQLGEKLEDKNEAVMEAAKQRKKL